MTNITHSSGIIAGGMETMPQVLKCGGLEKIVGENVQWFMRDKFYELKYASDNNYANNFTDKKLLKIINLKIPLHFSNIIEYNDSINNKFIVQRNTLHDKVIGILEDRLNKPIKNITEVLTEEYDLKHPLNWSASILIHYLAFIHKKYNKNSKKIPIAYELLPVIEKVHHWDIYFSYDAKNSKKPSNIKDLILLLIENINTSSVPEGKWADPMLVFEKKPTVSNKFKECFDNKLKLEKKELYLRIQGKENIEQTKEYIFSILNMENYLTDHLSKIEKYYILHAENIVNLLNSLKIFFKE
jgi:hypothetical protein